MPAATVAGVLTGQHVQQAEQGTQQAEGPPAAVRPGALDVPGDQDALSLVHGHRLLRRAPFGREVLLLQVPEQRRVPLRGGERPVGREDPGHPVRPVMAAGAVYAQIEFGQPGHPYPVAVLQVGGQRVLP